MLNRRHLLKAFAAGGIGFSAEALGLAAWQRAALAASTSCSTTGGRPWGDLQTSVVNSTLSGPAWDCNFQGYKILEIYLYLGASPWETLWVTVDNFSNPDTSLNQLYSLTDALYRLDWKAACANPDLPANSSGDTSNYFSFGMSNITFDTIYWGPAAKPLWNRPDILPRCRMVTQQHDLMPHEAAVPYCLTGLRLGDARAFGTAAAVERRAREKNSARKLPASYVLHRGAPLAEGPVAATGQHPAYCRPLVIRVTQNNDFYDSLTRAGIAPESDTLLTALRGEFRDRMRYAGLGVTDPVRRDLVRSLGFDGYESAADLLKTAADLKQLFPGHLLQIDPIGIEGCAEFRQYFIATLPQTTQDRLPPPTQTYPASTKTMLAAAASLLAPSNPSNPSTPPAQYVCVIDSGFVDTYDTHGSEKERHLLVTNANLYDLFKNLAALIAPPGTNPAGMINLDDTLVVITTEFGRFSDRAGNNRNHNPGGYPVLLMGGPILAAPSPSVNVAGAIDLGKASAPDVGPEARLDYSPTDLRGAMLLAAGIDPFAPNNFEAQHFSADIGGGTAGDREQIKNSLRDTFFGS
jgi:hypothetical protein